MSRPRTDAAGIRDGFLRAWAPVLLWLVVIGFTSGDVGARAHSDVWIWRVMHEWLPRVLGLEPSTGAPSFLPAWVRKLAHVAEYAVLGLLTTRALTLPRSGRRRGSAHGAPPGVRTCAAAIALACCAGVAILDELHQSTLPSRTGSPRDVLIDMLGAAAGVVVAVLVWRRRWVPHATG
jgi:VanZ family protein